jgi:uncharacterized protein (DUF1778 family)
MKKKNKEKIPYVRINTRVKEEHSLLIKKAAKKRNKTEGEIVRLILDKYFKLK